MSIETYWTVVPIIGLCIVVPFWAWLRFTRPKHKAKAGRVRRLADDLE
jgi:hypothetical protein